MAAPEIACVAQTHDVLGEVPIWSVRDQALYWIDGFKPACTAYDPATRQVQSWTPPVKLGSFALRAAGGFLLASRQGIGVYDPAAGTFQLRHDPESDRPNNLLNDGRCDRRGRFWVGSMDKMLQQESGRIYRYDPDGTCTVAEDPVYLTNGVAFSPDDRWMYFADSHHKTIYRYDFDLAAGRISNRRPIATITEGVPDGSCVDAEGFLWNAQFDAGRVVRYAPDGRLDRTVMLPVTARPRAPSAAPDLRTLYITTASFRLKDAEKAAQPHAGGLLAVDVGVAGVEEPMFGG